MDSKIYWLLAFVGLYWSYCIFWGIKGAITSKSKTVVTVANTLSGPELITNTFRTLMSSIVGAPPFPNALEPYATVNYIWTLSCLTVDELNRPDATYRKYGPRIIICRSGASTIAENIISGTPAIYFPLENTSGNFSQFLPV